MLFTWRAFPNDPPKALDPVEVDPPKVLDPGAARMMFWEVDCPPVPLTVTVTV